MAGLRELRKRLRSIKTTGQIAMAMRTAATAKYSRVNQVRAAFTPYSEGCRSVLASLGGEGIRGAENATERDCVVLISGNRGLCGGFHAELFRYAEGYLAESGAKPLLLAVGKKAAGFFHERGLEEECFELSDIPSFEETKKLSDRLLQIYREGEAQRIVVIYQHFHNMLTQTPGSEVLLPAPGEEARETEGVYLPDRESIAERLALLCFESAVYEIALTSASGAQAATLMAMRSACDNAEESAQKLEITINRRRQAEVTAGVIETASGAFAEIG